MLLAALCYIPVSVLPECMQHMPVWPSEACSEHPLKFRCLSNALPCIGQKVQLEGMHHMLVMAAKDVSSTNRNVCLTANPPNVASAPCSSMVCPAQVKLQLEGMHHTLAVASQEVSST